MNPSAFPTDWLLAAAAVATLLSVVAMGVRRLRGPLIAAATTCIALALAEVGAWRWFVAEPPPPMSGINEPGLPAGIILPASVLPSKDRLPERRGGRPRVLFTGDSFTEGFGVPYDTAFATLVGRELDVEIVNHGLTGTDTPEQQLRWRRYSRDWEPDVVVWVFVLNDLLPRIPGGPDYLMRYEPRPILGSYLLGMTRVVLARRMAQARTVEGYAESLDPARNREGFAQLTDTLREVHADLAARGGRLVLAIFPLMWNLQDYPFAAGHANIAAAAAGAGAEVLDLLPAFRGQHAPELWVSRFDHHPNQRGHALAAPPLADALRAGPLVAEPARAAAPTPAQWLNAARETRARDGDTLGGLRVAMTLAAAAARLAEVRGGPDGAELAARAWAFARQCQEDMRSAGRPQAPSLDPSK